MLGNASRAGMEMLDPDTRRLLRSMLSLKEMNRVAIGVMIHNEAGNLPGLLERLRTESIEGVYPDPIVVVSSGSTDESEAIVEQVAREDDRVHLISENERRGKAHAINQFLDQYTSEADICILISGDVLPESGALARLVEPLRRPDVGMTGGRVIPVNPRHTPVGQIVHALWALHHAVARRQPKLGEMVAFRSSIGRLDPRTPVDEASIEAKVIGTHQRLVYVPEARVYNRGPANIAELIQQRQRIWRGHRWLRKHTGYTVATYRLRDLMLPAIGHLIRHPLTLPGLIAATLIEIWSRLEARHSKAPLPTVWAILSSTKAPIQPS